MSDRAANAESETADAAKRAGLDALTHANPTPAPTADPAKRLPTAVAPGDEEELVRQGRPDYLYLRNIDRALVVGDLGIFAIAGFLVFVAVMGADRALTYAAGIAVATFVFSRILESNQVYKSAAHKFDLRLARRLGQSILITFALISAAAIGFDMHMQYPREVLFAWVAIASSGIVLYRVAVALVVRVAIRSGRLRRRVAIYGGGPQGEALIGHLENARDVHYSVVGFYDERFERVPHVIEGYKRRGGMKALEDAVASGFVDEVIVALPLSAVDRLNQIMNRMAQYSVTVLFAPDLAMWRFFDRPFEVVGGAPMLRALEAPIEGWAGVAKFFEDRIIAALLLVLAAPLMAAVTLAIKLDSKGPVFFRQPRRGWNGGVFTIYKFRTMRTDMADEAGSAQTVKGDPRVTRVGHFLRRTSIDELPQLINVLRGDMSLVGPRPHALGTKAGDMPFEEAMANYMRRYRVKPGITGWAQVNGWRGETDTSQKLLVRVRYDVEYIENWTFWFDIYILAMTPLSLIFRSHNAY